ncbi:phosphotransferase [Pseudonocardia spirodelae]|uniref:Phosphotransferase n=1 Tax=Pseudonocardia spirodelae TaxID=3133431 RepID=A0ABU8T6N4_9PSEU
MDAARVDAGGGWDSAAVLVDGVWLERTARRPDVEPWLRTETRLLPWLAPRLPLPVPVPHVVGEDPLVVRHRVLPGEPVTAPGPALGAALGRFLRALHAVPVAGAVARGVPGPEDNRALRAAALARFRGPVADLLPGRLRGPVAALCDRLAVAPVDTLVHGDLNPDHLLVDAAGRLTGVIDWSDSRAGDPAKDLAWALVAAPRGCADAVAATYGVTPALRARAGDWHRAGPLFAVAFGLDTGDDGLVRAGCADAARLLTA